GSLDLVATRWASSFAPEPDRVIVRRAIKLANGATIPTLDFAQAEARALTSATVTLDNAGLDFVQTETDLITANGTSHVLGTNSLSTSNSTTYLSLPAALVASTDLHALNAFASSTAGTRSVTQYYKTPASRTLTFGPMVNTATLTTVATTPYLRVRSDVVSQAEYSNAVAVTLSQSSVRFVSVF